MKKVLVIFLVVSIVLMIFNIAVFADTTSTMTSKEYYAAQSYLIDKYCDGEITYEQFQEQSQAVTNEYVTANTVGGVLQGGALNASNTVSALTQKVGSTVDKYGDEARGYVSDWWNSTCNKKGVPTETTQTSNMDMRGYKACCLSINNYGEQYYKYSNYIIIDSSNSSYYFRAGPCRMFTVYPNGYSDWWSSETSSSINESYTSNDKFYGDIRYADGTPYPTDDEYTYSTVKKYDEMTEKQLEDLIDDFSDKMTLENPDLSSLEGLLNAIYARLGTLDSDNDNELLSSINANILALIEADNNKIESDSSTNEELVKTLIEIRDNLKDGNIGSTSTAFSHGHEIAGTLYNVILLDKNFFDNLLHGKDSLKVSYNGEKYYLEDCGCLKLNGKYYAIDLNYDDYSLYNYDINTLFSDFGFSSAYLLNNGNENISPLSDDFDPNESFGTGEGSKLDEDITALKQHMQPYIDYVVDGVSQELILAVPYKEICSGVTNLQNIIFDDYTPQDIKISLFGNEYTLLSAAMLYHSRSDSDDDINHGGDDHGGGGSGGNRDDVNSIVLFSENPPDGFDFGGGNACDLPYAYAHSINVIRSLTSILIGFTWALSMRKKIVSMI